MNLAVIKVGGSLAAYPEKLRQLCQKLSNLSKKHSFLIVPGGGEFADTVRVLDRRFGLSSEAAHKMAVLGMDQYGLLLADLTPNSVTINNLELVNGALEQGKLPIILPANLMFIDESLEHSWDVTSDSIACYLAVKLHASMVVLVKDVDGIYAADPKKNPHVQLIENLSAAELLGLSKQGCVDRTLVKLLKQYTVDCYIVNGLFPERLESVLAEQKTICTAIKP
jgi:5-(aminomethyl)-3-furanmethanol phosphate kinase